jgi:hypothetical protein
VSNAYIAIRSDLWMPDGHLARAGVPPARRLFMMHAGALLSEAQVKKFKGITLEPHTLTRAIPFKLVEY